jgi:iron-sulfur cluster assembly accessory protein
MEQKAKTLISKDMLISDMIEKYPEAVDTLLSTGISCVGCEGSGVESIEQGLTGHGFSEKEVEDLIVKLNKAVKESPKKEKSGEPLIISDKAADKLKQILKEQKKEGYGLRVVVMAGGCSGYQYGFDFENKKKDGDNVIETKGQKFFIDKQSLEMLHGSTVDYIDSLQGSGFKIDNPNAKQGCGCGKSFR